MKAIIAICTLITGLCGTLVAQEEKKPVKDQYMYVDLGLGPAPFPIPVYGIGYRYQSNKHGFNTVVRTSTIVVATEVKLGAHYFHYFNPNVNQQFYIGGGPAVGLLVEGSHWSLDKGAHWLVAPEVIFGKSYRSDTGATRFFEVALDFPTFTQKHKHVANWDLGHGDVLWFPLVTFHYGWGF